MIKKASVRWFPRTYAAKIILFTSLLIIGIIVVQTFFFIRTETTYLQDRLIEDKKSSAELLAINLGVAQTVAGLAFQSNLIKEAGETSDTVYIRFAKPNGEIYLSNIVEERGAFITDPAINTDRTVVKDDIYKEESIKVVVSPVSGGYTVWLGFSLHRVQAAVNERVRDILLVSSVILIIVNFIAYFIARRMTYPLKELRKGVEVIGKGNLDYKVEVKSRDEIGELAGAFNKMADDLQTTTVSRDYVDNIIGSMLDALIVVDPEARIITVNKATCELLGYKKEELIGKPAGSIFAAEEEMPLKPTKTGKLTEESQLRNYETHYKTKDGKKIPVLLSCSAMRDKDGNIICMVCTARDITKRKQAEEALQCQQAYFKQLFDDSPDAIAWLDDADRVIDANKGFKTLFGYRAEEIKGRPIDEIVVPEDRIEEAAAISRDALNKKVVREETVRKRKDGSLVDVFILAYPIQFGNRTVGVYAIYSDITERKQMEEALRKSEEKYRTLFESKLDGMVVIDETMKPLLANKTAAEMFGFDSVEELLEVNIFDYIPPEERERALKIITKDMFEKDMRQVNEFRLMTKSGKEIWISAIGALTEYEGRVAGLISLRDITERKQMEEQLVRSERLAAIGQLGSGVAHELRSPLGAIKTAAFYVQRRIAKSDLPATEPKVLEFLDIIDGEVNIASKVISDLLGFSRVAKPKVSPVNLGGIIEDALEHVPIPENVNLARDIGESLPMVMVDAEQIQQVFVNVIFNAVEAMPEGGRLGIRARSKGEFVEVEFTDTGCGIPKSDIDNIFDPLFTTKARGIGLGLAVCKSILERHGGDIRVKSKVRKGSTFTVSLPAQEI